MTASIKRNAFRWIHTIAGLVVGTYIYAPYSDLLWFEIFSKALVIPTTALTGMWMWKGHKLGRKSYPLKTLGILGLLLLLGNIQTPATAQEQEPAAENRWGVEFSPIGAGVFRLAQGKWTYALNPGKAFKTELGLGYLIQPSSTAGASEAFNSDGLYSAYMASVAARQYLWKGLHLEEVVNFGRGSITDSKVDGRDYDSFVVFSQTFIGYKFNFWKREKFNFFIIGQAGLGYVPLSTNRWPRVDEDASSIYGLGDMKIGINF